MHFANFVHVLRKSLIKSKMIFVEEFVQEWKYPTVSSFLYSDI